MKAILSLVAIAALALSLASPARAGSICGGYAQIKHHHHSSSAKKHSYGKRMHAQWIPAAR